jgi:hypothetical protein
MGVRVALDDFGTGYSSLAYVQRLPLDIIKIDREFVQSLGRQADDALTRIIVTMAHNLGLETIGEGVEEESQVIGLAEIGCDYTQGFLFSEPLTASSMAAMLEDLADRDHVRQPVDLVIAVDAAPSPIVIAPPTAAAAPPTGSSSAAAPPVSTRRAVRSSTPAAQPAAPAAPEAPASVESTAPAAPLSAPASPLPKTRRRTGRDEQPARLVRPLISTSSSDDTDARHDA